MTVIPLCPFDELVDGTSRRFPLDQMALAVVRIGDEVFCINDRCSHEDFSLSEGEVLVEEKELECARHGATFRLDDGTPCSFPATTGVATYHVAVRDGMVEVTLP
jgi:3-phenylpropionate/trans-cinnamate dioxygenase ferredoxin subunit